MLAVPLVAIASPVYTSPALVTMVVAVAPRLSFHPAIVPSSVAKMNNADVLAGIGNWPVALPTIPVGLLVLPAVAPGTVTNGSALKIFPLPSISSETPVPSSLIQKGVLAEAMNVDPHGLTIFESVFFAWVPLLPIRLTTLNDETDSATVLRTCIASIATA